MALMRILLHDLPWSNFSWYLKNMKTSVKIHAFPTFLSLASRLATCSCCSALARSSAVFPSCQNTNILAAVPSFFPTIKKLTCNLAQLLKAATELLSDATAIGRREKKPQTHTTTNIDHNPPESPGFFFNCPKKIQYNAEQRHFFHKLVSGYHCNKIF